MKTSHSSGSRNLREEIGLFLRIVRLGGALSPRCLPIYISNALVEALTPFINIVLSAQLLGELAGNRETSRLTILIVTIVVLNFIFFIMRYALQRYIEVLVVELDCLLGVHLSRKTMSIDYEYMEDPKTLDMHQNVLEARSQLPSRIESQMKLFGDVLKSTIQLIAAVGLVARLITLPVIGNYSGILSFIDSHWALFALGTVICLTFYTNTLAVTAQAKAREAFVEAFRRPQRKNLFYYYLFDNYHIGKDIRLYNAQEMLADDIQNLRSQLNTATTLQMRDPLPLTSANVGLTAICSGVVYLYICTKSLLGSIAIGEAMLYIGAINQFSIALNSLGSSFTMMRTLAPFSKYYFDYLDLQPVKPRGTIPLIHQSTSDYHFEFKNVSFNYPRSEQLVIQNVSFTLEPGKRVAVVGMNGAGKTTIIKLLCRLYDPTAGQILLNGIDIREYKYDDYMTIFSVVFQDYSLFAYPVGESVACESTYDDDRVWHALKDADVADKVRSMPLCLKQYLYRDVSREGYEISGGEAQKVAIARALYRNAPVFILDEPTAALDPISEFQIYSTLDTIIGHKSAIFISHRLSSCLFCDDILVFHHGELIQRGTHSRLLMDVSGKYHEMWQAQAQYYQDEELSLNRYRGG